MPHRGMTSKFLAVCNGPVDKVVSPSERPNSLGPFSGIPFHTVLCSNHSEFFDIAGNSGIRGVAVEFVHLSRSTDVQFALGDGDIV